MCFDVCIQKASAKIQVSWRHVHLCSALNGPIPLISVVNTAGVLLMLEILQ